MNTSMTAEARDYGLYSFKYGYFSYTNTLLPKAFINPLETYGAYLMKDGWMDALFLGFKILTHIPCHYKSRKNQNIF